MSINFHKFSSLLEFWLAILGKIPGMHLGKTVQSKVLELLPLDLLSRHTWLVYDLILIVQILSYYFLFMNVNMTGYCMYDLDLAYINMYLHVIVHYMYITLIWLIFSCFKLYIK